MLRRWCALSLLIASVLQPISALEVTEAKIQHVQTMPQFVAHIESLKPYYDHSDFQSLEILLDQLPALTQEVARSQLIQYASEVRQFNAARIAWLTIQAERQSPFTITEQGDGYTVQRMAFFYSNQANGLLREWKKELVSHHAVINLERGKLTLSEWLKGDLEQQQKRSKVIVRAIPQLSNSAIDVLVEQFHSDPKLLWLPDNSIIAVLAAYTDDSQLYDLLWRRRTDQYSLAEIQRLSITPASDFVVSQLIAATSNPSLKEPAYRALTSFNPLPEMAKSFLQIQLGDQIERSLITPYLMKQGHDHWLQQLLAISTDPDLVAHIKEILPTGQIPPITRK
ncbi:hypothetical protein SKA34_17075 [Photobacterium sp. SKA34]|uniref:hypothetical protein n=1 Tax=Photobacterium sp. SKA34 TaxID=121723 RepID=UPI00006BEB4F|nr:hypothetical protein [Photobacterium sp. SKA34]EAR55902.1 hypothetical protein SKA34_17075 [Photobacterium sp. SKA34]